MIFYWQKLILTLLLIILTIIFPDFVFADDFSNQCSKTGYTVLTINGIFTDEIGAQNNADALRWKLDKDFNSQPLTVDYLHNPSHFAGLGDLAKVVYQKIFENETVRDYDLVEMLKDASEKVKTQKLLLVAHSQGNFYANSFYDTVAGKEGGVSAESIGVYSVATPASRAAGGGKWLTSDTDKVIADIVASMPFKKIMEPNTSIVLAEGDDAMGHNFSGVYLRHRGSQIVSDIQSSLDKLQTNDIQNKSLPCLAPPKLTLAHKATGVVFAVVDPAANTGKDAIVVASSGIYQAGKALAQGAYSLTSFIAGATASVLSGDNKNTNNEAVVLNAINSENISSLPVEEVGSLINESNSNSSATSADNSQPATLTATNLKLAEESLQNLQNQLLALQNQTPSRTVFDGGVSSGQSNVQEPRFVAAIIPGFGGGGTGVAESSSAGSFSLSASSSSSSADSASESSSSSLPADLPAEEAGEASSSSSASEPSSSSSNSSSSSSVPDAPDTTPPVISSFSISECQQSLSTDGCLVATTTLNIAWNSLSVDLDYFIINNNGSVSATTSTSTIATAPDNAVFSFAVSAKDLAGNFSATSTQTAEISTMPVVINEVAWAGNSAAYSADEWIELYNRTSKIINLTDWTLYSKTNLTPYVNLSGQIISKDYYLLERTNDDTISNIAADKIYTGDLLNSGENIALVYNPAGQATTTIDEIPYDTNWYAGSSFNYSTMERYDADTAGANPSNWGTNNSIIKNGKNAGGGNINGTPKARNSANYLIAKGASPISSSVILTKSNSPYLVNNYVQVFNASSTLTVEPGVVIKFYNDAGLSFNSGAKIYAVGSSAEPIIFTSFYDDTYAGDTNGDATSTAPSAGNWYGVRINSPGAESAISDAIFRYGGKYYNGPWSDSRANLYIANSSAIINGSIFEYSKVYGLKMIYSDSSIVDSIFRNNNNVSDTAGYDSSLLAIGGSPSLSRNSFASNHRGAYFFNSSAAVDSNTFDSNTGEAIYSYGQLGSYSNNSGSSNGVDTISLSGTITQNGATTTLTVNTLPYLLRGNVIVAASSTLAVNSGAAIKGWNTVSTSYLSIYGELIVSGANFSDIIFGSMYSSPAKGNWGGLRFYPGSYSAISGATFEYANTAIAYIGSPINLGQVKFNENDIGLSANVASRAYPINASGITFTNNTATTSPGGLW